MTKRLFTFGCSGTCYQWPTWADILSQEFDQFENWGRVGGGNHFILYSLIEAIQRRNINKDDTVGIMFTSVCREDRWLNGKWYTPGSVYTSELGEKYIENFTDPTGFYLTNITVIDAIIKILQNTGCQYHLMSGMPLNVTDDSWLKKVFKLTKNITEQVDELYQSSLQQIKPSAYKVIYNSNFNSRSNIIIPSARLKSIEILKKSYIECAGKDWPQFEDFITDNTTNISKDILKEIETQFNFYSWRDNINSQRQDTHLIPLEQIEYLEKIGFHLTERQKSFAHYWNERVLSTEEIGWTNKPVDRF